MNKIASAAESPSISRENTVQKSDGSFDLYFEAAKKLIEEKKKISLFASWGNSEKSFNIIPLEFEFDFKSNKIEENPKNKPGNQQIIDKNENDTPKQPPIANKPESLQKQKNQNASNNLPLPQAMNLPLNLNNFMQKQITKNDLKFIIDEIAEKASFLKTKQYSELQINILPEDLGELMLSLSLKNGQVSIQIYAASIETKKYLEDNIYELESALKSAKISLKDIKVVEVKDGNHTKSRG
ncbi:MAG: flagellar hook-length control protein [Candidatus Saganbacteria bacterium]|uniref:Flagellar hook-length control protein n=1 Tax=Candidatus Saganbacteria bacterium TaxID=2575572 RepID=A0A833L021_UNCSA|nr:MAG: flagellar hook-length control protein [Candidatus Saganbacteria bacterium]